MPSTWKTRTELLQDLSDLVHQGRNCAVFGARNDGLVRRLLEVLSDLLSKESLFSSRYSTCCILVRLSEGDEEKPSTVADLVRTILEAMKPHDRAVDSINPTVVL